MPKAQKAPDFKPFEELTFKEAPVLYDPDVPQVVSFNDRRFTKAGVVDIRVAHTLAPLSDPRFMQREQEFADQDAKKVKKGDEIFGQGGPSEKLWQELALERSGYKASDDWKKRVKPTHQSIVLSAFLQIDLDETESDALNDDFLIDDAESTCMAFRAFFGGIPLEDWKNWLTTGKFPSNVLLDQDLYERAVILVRKGIAPNIWLEVRHFFHEPSKTNLDAAIALLFGKPDRSKLASAAARRDDKTPSDRWVELYEAVKEGKPEGYAKRVPVWHRIATAQAFFTQEVARLGESVNG